MSLRAWVYIWSILIVAAGLAVINQADLPLSGSDWLTFGALTTLAILAQFLEVDYGSKNSYYPHMVFFFAGVILLPPVLFVLLVTIPHLVEWIKKRLVSSSFLRDWYIQPFNIATHIIAGSAAHRIFTSIGSDGIIVSPQSTVLAATTAALSYVLFNHVLVGQALVLARGISWQDSGILDVGNLITELIMLGVGYVVALLWSFSPWLILPALSPLGLIYRALKVPQLEKEAQTDEKTGLWNVRHFDKRFGEELAIAQRFERPLAIIMADLDLLRDINNTYGHLAGDAVIAEVAQIIRSTIREFDVAGRFGGEEFAIVLPNTDLGEACAVAERIRRAVSSTPFEVSTSQAPIQASMSFGVAGYPRDGTVTTDLIYQADIALYQAKLKGRNAVVSTIEVPHSTKLEFEHSRAEKHAEDGAEPTDQEDDGQAVTGSTLAPGVAAAARPDAVESISEPVAEPVAATSERHYSRTMLGLYLGGVIITGLVIGLSGIFLSSPVDFMVIAQFTVLALVGEWLQVNVYERSTVSVSMAFVFAVALICGIPGVVATSAAIVFAHYMKRQPALYKLAFNWSTHVIAGAAPALAIRSLDLPLTVDQLPLLAVPALTAALVYYALETGLIAAAIGLSEQSSIQMKWREQFRWLGRHYLVMGLMGLFLAIAYTAIGPLSLLVFVLPVFMMHFVQKEYVQGTEDSVRELRRMNQELSHANQEIVAANQAIQQLNDELFVILAKIIDARDPYVSGHATKVAEYARAIAVELGLSEERVGQIHQAGLLHDIGKIGISEAILHKPHQLSAEEFQSIMRHVSLGADLLETCQGLRHLAPFVRHHHERWDGTGYPSQLQAEAIPLEARILAVCDAVEAMASDRPYHQAMSLGELVSELKRHAGTQFDPGVVEAFTQVLEKKGPNIVVNSALEVTRTRPNSDAPLADGQLVGGVSQGFG